MLISLPTMTYDRSFSGRSDSDTCVNTMSLKFVLEFGENAVTELVDNWM